MTFKAERHEDDRDSDLPRRDTPRRGRLGSTQRGDFSRLRLRGIVDSP